MASSTYDPDTGAFQGVTLPDGRGVPFSMTNRDWLDFLAANPGWDTGDRGPPTAQQVTAALRAYADALVSADPSAASKLLRAVVLLTLDEVNVLRDFDAQLKSAVAAASSLADLKTRVASITTNLSPRTKAQLVSAIVGKIDAGDAD